MAAKRIPQVSPIHIYDINVYVTINIPIGTDTRTILRLCLLKQQY